MEDTITKVSKIRILNNPSFVKLDGNFIYFLILQFYTFIILYDNIIFCKYLKEKKKLRVLNVNIFRDMDWNFCIYKGPMYLELS